MINSSNKVHIIYLAYTIKLSFYYKKIGISLQKINKFYLNIFEMLIANLLVMYILKKIWFFQKIVLLANISIKIDLKIFSLTFCKTEICFAKQKLVWRTYKAVKILLTIK